MLIAIDTSTRYGGVCIWSGDRAVAATFWYSPRNHTAELMPAIQHVLERAQAGPGGLTGVAVALGPGGFSALRVGISAAMGLAVRRNIPLVGVGTLETEAYPHADTGLPICSLLDAGRGEVAAAMFQSSEGVWRKLREESLWVPEELAGTISTPTIICGEAASHHAEELRQGAGDSALIMGFYTPASRLWALGILAAERLRMGDADGLETIRPIYLRQPNIGKAKAPRRVLQ